MTRPSKRSSRGRSNRRGAEHIITGKNFDFVKIFAPANRPDHISNPPLSRVVRLTSDFTASSTNTVLEGVTANLLALQDQTNYGTSAIRWQYVRINTAKAWLTGIAISGDLVTRAYLQDALTGALVESQPSAATKVASLGCRLPLETRALWYSTTATNTVLSLTIDSEVGAQGTWVLDVSVDFR